MDRAALFPFVRSLSPRAQTELGAISTTRARPSATLLTRGAACGGAYLVLQGALRVYYLTEEGREATLYRVAAGDTCVLALSSTLRAQPYPAWVQASRTGATFLQIPDRAFHRLVADEPAFRTFVLEAMSARIFELMCALEQLATRSITQRVAAYLLEHAQGGEVAVTQEALAAELGTAREVVFRALTHLANRNLVAKTRGRIKLLDPAALARLAR